MSYPPGPPSSPPPQPWDAGQGGPQWGAPGGYTPHPGYAPPGGYQGGYPQGGWGPPPAPPGPPQQPTSIRVAVTAMWIGAVLSVLSGLSAFLLQDQLREEAERQLATQDASGIDVDTLVTFALVAAGIGAVIGTTLWIVHAINVGKGRSWARITGSVLYAITLVGFLINLTQPNPGLSVAFSVLNQIVALVALVAMWLPDSNRFVNESTRARRGSYY